MNESAKAIKYMELAVEWTSSAMSANNPARAPVLVELAEMYGKTGNYQKALALLDTAHELLTPLKNDPLLTRCLVDLGAVCEKLHQLDRSKTYFNAAIEQLTRTGIHEMPQYTLDELSAFRDSLAKDDKSVTVVDKILSAAKRNRLTQSPLKHG